MANWLGSIFAEKGPRTPFGKVEHEAAMCPCSGEGQQHTVGGALLMVEEGDLVPSPQH